MNLAKNRIGLLEKPMESEIQRVLRNCHKPTIQEFTKRIHESLMSTGSKQLQDAAVAKAKKLGFKVPEISPHTLPYDRNESEAYVACRMPATFAATFSILSEISRRIPDLNPKTILDFGTGPGTCLWAAKKIWSSLENAKAIDSSEHMLEIFDKFSDINREMNNHESFKNIETMRFLPVQKTAAEQDKFDIVISAFTLSDLPNDTNRKFTLNSLWNQTSDMLILIDRGTPVGFDLISKARQYIIDLSEKENTTMHIVSPVILNLISVHTKKNAPSLKPDLEIGVIFPRDFSRVN